jgi:hypothetical protein
VELTAPAMRLTPAWRICPALTVGVQLMPAVWQVYEESPVAGAHGLRSPSEGSQPPVRPAVFRAGLPGGGSCWPTQRRPGATAHRPVGSA